MQRWPLCLIKKQSNKHAFGRPLLIYPQKTIYYYSTVTIFSKQMHNFKLSYKVSWVQFLPSRKKLKKYRILNSMTWYDINYRTEKIKKKYLGKILYSFNSRGKYFKFSHLFQDNGSRNRSRKLKVALFSHAHKRKMT